MLYCSVFVIAALLVAGVFCTLWRQSVARAARREQLWSSALGALASRDYDDAAAVADILERQDNAAPLAAALRRTRDALEAESNERDRPRRDLEDVLSSLQDGVLVVDSEGRLRFLNAAALQMFNVRIEDVLGAQVLEALPSFGIESAVRAALREGKMSEREVHLYAPRMREVLMRVAPVRRAGVPFGVGQTSGAVAILQDLTEMRRLERVRRDFVANASHELRTPISTIRAMAETILDAPEDTALVSRFLPQLVSEAERLSRLVGDLLALAHAEAPMETPHQPVDLVTVVYDTIQQLKHKAIQSHVEIGCQFQNGYSERACVTGDAASLGQVVFNLVDNALSYTPAGGTITLQIANGDRVAQSSEEPDAENDSHKSISLAVSDSGIGIPSADLSRIFERFYRVDKARSRAQGGTGLGLAIVKNIVENHGGHVEAESEEGKGTTFTVTLPAAG